MDMREVGAFGGGVVPAIDHQSSQGLRAFLWDIRS